MKWEDKLMWENWYHIAAVERWYILPKGATRYFLLDGQLFTIKTVGTEMYLILLTHYLEKRSERKLKLYRFENEYILKEI